MRLSPRSRSGSSRLRLVLSALVALGTGAALLAPAPAQAATSGFVTRSGGELKLNGAPYTFSGLNAYSATTVWGTNAGCGPMMSTAQLDAMFAGLKPNSVVRIWAFQELVTHQKTRKRDWSPLDRVLSSARAHNQRVIPSLANHWGDCDDAIRHTKAWYDGGYKQVVRNQPQSYWNYVQAIAKRYRNDPTIAMWELINEPETPTDTSGSCKDEHASAVTLRTFFDTVGARVKAAAPSHLIESGVVGDGQCGASGGDYSYVHASPQIDVGSFHDYGNDSVQIPGDKWNGMQTRLDQLKALGKPMITGEVGIKASDTAGGCKTTLAGRASLLQRKRDGQSARGVKGFLVWNYMPTNDGSCNYETVTAGDPVLSRMLNN
ncbi:MAG: beta-mannosidase [Frankiales bacterium]|nr:beta-mannosidase [Frankiales bacterium]